MLNWGGVFQYTYQTWDGKTPPKESENVLPVTCTICGADTDAEIKARFITHENKYIKLPTPEMAVHNFFLRCTRCNGAMLLMWPYGEDFHGRGLTATRLLFPFRTDAFNIEDIEEGVIPKAILLDLMQAELSYYAGAYLGAGLLLRRACQYICRDKHCRGKSLLDQIEDLHIKGLITIDLAEMANSVRIVGNEIAHPDPNNPFIIEPSDIEVCYEFMKQLIQTVYINPYRIKKFKNRLSQRGLK